MNLYHFFLLFLNFINFISSQFIFEIKREIKEPTEDNYLDYITNNRITTEIKIGEPPQTIIASIDLYQHAFYISPIEKGGTYNYKLSKTYSNQTGEEYYYSKQCLRQGYHGNESFIFKTIDGEDKKLKDINFIMGENRNIEYCFKLLNAQIGLTYIKYSKLFDSNYITYLNQKEILKSYAFFFQFANNSNEKDYLIIGGYPHEFDSDNYDNKNLKKGYIENDNFWNIIMIMQVDGNSSKIESYCKLDILMKGIQGSYIYQRIIDEMFFNKYFDSKLCFKNESKDIFQGLLYYTCDLSIDIQKFPNLFFKFESMNYTFNLTYNDLFIKFNNKYYFLIVFHRKISRDWILGEIFIKKYNLIFDQNIESVSLYTNFTSHKKKKDKDHEDKKNENEGNKSLLKILVLIFFLSTVILSILLYNIILKFPRKKRANELDETFEYNSKEEVQKTDYSKLIN